MGDENQNLEKVSMAIKKNDESAIAKDISALHNELVVKKDKARMPETIFTNNFLEFFKNGNINETNVVLGAKWVEYAGNPENEVDIINNEGEVLYTVPPLISGIDLRNEAIQGINYDVIQQTFKLKHDYSPSIGQKYLGDALNAVSEKVINTVDNKQHSETWKEIFNRYDQPKKEETKETVGKKATKLSTDDDMVEY